jgi:hypothetical protein
MPDQILAAKPRDGRQTEPELCPFQFVVAGVWRGSLASSNNLKPEGKVT